MPQNINERCERLQKAITTKKAKHEEVIKTDGEEYHTQADTRHALYAIYQALEAEYYTHCKFNPKPQIKIVFGGNFDEIAPLVQEACGLSFTWLHGHHIDRFINIDLSNNAKVCTGQYVNSARETLQLQLDFPGLIDQFKYQDQLWQNRLPRIAQECVKLLQYYLEHLPRRVYGVEKCLALPTGKSTTKVKLLLGEQIKEYSKLTKPEITELVQVMNSYIHGGYISVTSELQCGDETINCDLWRDEKATAKNPLFDYGAFCAIYDAVTPELEKVFQEIAEYLEPVPVKEHFRQLEFQRVLLYYFGKNHISFKDATDGLSEGARHQSAFLNFLSEKLQVKVLGNIFTRDNCLKIFYEPLPDQPEPNFYNANGVVQKIQKEINEIQTTKIPEIVAHLLDWILNDAEENVQKKRLRANC